MSSFSSKGYRQHKIEKNKTTQKHIKSFYKIMYDMEVISQNLDKSIEYTEDNIDDYVEPIYGRKLDSMEKMLILGKIYHSKNETKDNV